MVSCMTYKTISKKMQAQRELCSLTNQILYRSDNLILNELLASGNGNDLTAELSGCQYRSATDYITTHFKVGKFVYNDSEEKVKFSLIYGKRYSNLILIR